MKVRSRLSLGFALLVSVMAGCSGNSRSPVEGTVNYDGKPLPLGSIAFLPTFDTGIKTGGRIENGRFKIEGNVGPLPGHYKVQIHWLKPTGEKYKDEYKQEWDKYEEGLPDKYAKEADTILEADITSGHNSLTFNLDK